MRHLKTHQFLLGDLFLPEQSTFDNTSIKVSILHYGAITIEKTSSGLLGFSKSSFSYLPVTVRLTVGLFSLSRQSNLFYKHRFISFYPGVGQDTDRC